MSVNQWGESSVARQNCASVCSTAMTKNNKNFSHYHQTSFNHVKNKYLAQSSAVRTTSDMKAHKAHSKADGL